MLQEITSTLAYVYQGHSLIFICGAALVAATHLTAHKVILSIVTEQLFERLQIPRGCKMVVYLAC